MFIQIVGILIFAMAWMVAFAGIASAVRPIVRQLRRSFGSGAQKPVLASVQAPALQTFAAHIVSPRPARKSMAHARVVNDQGIRLVA